MKKLILAASLLFSFPALAQNYQATQGAGTTFGTKLVGGVNYPQFAMCDPATPANCVAVDASGRVTVLQGTSPWVVSNGGTFATQAAQSGTWTVQPGNTANTTAWLVTGTGGTFPATQSGNWTTRVVGNAGAIFDGATGAAVPSNVLYNGVNIGGNLAGWTGIATGATVKAATVAIVDASGNQITSFGGSGGTASNYGSAFPSSGTAAGFTDGTNMAAGRVGAVANVAAATNFLDSLGICQYLATPPTITDTRFNQVQCDINGNMKVTVANTNANGQATMANSSPVTIASNQTANALWGHGVTGAAVPANATYMGFNSGGNLTGPAIATPLPVRQSDGTNVGALDPCQTATVNSTPINISTATTTRIATEASSVRIYICHLSIVTAAANNVALIEGTGASCAGGTPAGMAGGTTAASGWNFSANGGISLGMGGFSINQTLNTNYSVCLVTSAATQLSGVIKWVAR